MPDFATAVSLPGFN
jgi:hypothetical protein